MKEEIIDFLKTKVEIDEIGADLNFIRVTGRLYPPIAQTIKEIKDFFATTAYTPFFIKDGKRDIIQFGMLQKAKPQQNILLNIILFIATVATTLFAGAMNSGGNPLQNFSDILLGIPFSFSIMAILTCHELGHYFISKREGMVTTLPYFIPMPFHPIGTFGAIIKMKSLVPSRRSLLRVGMAGPLAGFLVALPITIAGITLSEIKVVPEAEQYLRLGNSLLFWIIAKIIHPVVAEGADIYLHPMAFAGWLGFLVTSMNLIPIGQLDGGHVAFSIFMKKRRYMYAPLFAILIALGFLWPGWIVWLILVFFLTRQDPIIQDSITPITKQDKVYGLLTLIVFILTFMPQPFVVK